MRKKIQAACGSHIGKIRKKNEDNFCFNGAHLLMDHNAKVEYRILRRSVCSGQFAVFDGMGGENYGELAAYAAAKEMSAKLKPWKKIFCPIDANLHRQVEDLNQAVLKEKAKMQTSRMGTTMVSMTFKHGKVYVCNIGDSRAYRLRDDRLCQLSIDHVEMRQQRPGRKPPLTQHIGIDPEEMLIEPYIVNHCYQSGDVYLLCSDGLTDMVNDFAISDIMRNNEDPADCVDELIAMADAII